MKPVVLGDLFELKYGRSLRKDVRDKGHIPVYGSNGQVGYHSESLVNYPTIIVGRKGSIGEVQLVKSACWPIDTTYFIEPRKEHTFNLEWLFRLLKTLHLNKLNRSAAIPGLNRDDVYRIPLLLPELGDQERIAHLLGIVEGLIARRKQHLQQLDDLLKSVFLKMFGDDLRDESSYDLITKACDFIDYRGKTPSRAENGVPLISAKCVRRGYFDANRLDYVAEKTYKNIMTRGFPKPNDVLFTTEGATFGYTCRVPRHFERFSVGQRLITMACKDGYYPEVLEFVLNDQNIQKKLASRLSGSAALGIRSAELAKVAIPFPSSATQADFAAIVEKVETLKSRYQQSLIDLEILYGALSQKAFKGELDLSRVPLESDMVKDHNSFEADNTLTEVHLEMSDNSAISTPEGRIDFLKQCFSNWLDISSSSNMSFSNFLQEVQLDSIRLWGEDGFISELTLAEYDLFKDWLFEAINTGRIEQTRNPIEVDGKPDFGNQIILRRRDSGI